MPVAGEVVQLNPDGTVPEGAYYNPAAGAAIVIAGGVLDTGVPSTPPPDQDTASDDDRITFDDVYDLYRDQPEPEPEPEQVTLEEMQAIYRARLGREGSEENVMNWVNAVNTGQMTLEQADAGIAGSEEGLAYAASQAATDATTGNQTTTTTDTSSTNPNYGPNITAAIQAIEGDLYSAQEMADHFGISLDEFNAITDQYGGYTDPNAVVAAADGADDTVTGGVVTTATPTKDFSPLIQQYYQELFNRQAQQPGLDYFTGRLTSGDLAEDALRDAIISGATGTDRLYYEASQAGGPVFDATQALFGRRPARGTYNPATGQLEGGYGQYRSRLDAGQLTPEQLRRNLVDLAYRRGEGGGRSGDYQYYLNTLGIDRSDNPFLQDDGTYRNIPYGLNLAEYQQDPGMPAPPPSGGAVMDDVSLPPFDPDNVYKTIPYPGYLDRGTRVPGKGGLYQRPDGSYGGGGSPLGKGGGMPGRMPGQYITGNQLYSGMPYGMSQPMGMFLPQQPFNYGYSSQYMPNRGLMSGFSTGFGPYGGFQRPRFGGGKGGMMRPMPYGMGGGKGGFGY